MPVIFGRSAACPKIAITAVRQHVLTNIEPHDTIARRVPGQFDASILSDEAGPPGNPNFTGAFVGMCCQDLAGTGRPADFDTFIYHERGYRAGPFVDE